MFKGTVSSLLRHLGPSTQLARLPSGHRVARFGQILIYFFFFNHLKDRKTGSRSRPFLVYPKPSWPCPVQELVHGMRLLDLICLPQKGNKMGLCGLGCRVS